MSHSFYGGVHPDDRKTATSREQISALPPPPQVVIPMSLHIGAPCTPCVAVNDQVRVGQLIGSSEAFVSAPVHSSVSGTVVAVEPRLHPNGSMVMSVVIENDGRDALDESLTPNDSQDISDPEILAGIVRNAGIVGMGGAAFPTAVKIKSGIGKADTVIINAAECEPYITSDHRTLLEHPEEVIKGAKLLTRAFGLPFCYLAVEANKMDAVKLLEPMLHGDGEVRLRVLKTRYPQGAEKQLIQAITKREVPPGGLPADVGCVVFNAYTAYCVCRAVYEGLPATHRVVTVSGSAINNPGNFLTPVGTPLSFLVQAAGGFKEEPFKVLMGGPMMGVAQYSLDVPVIKGTNALLAFCGSEFKSARDPECIRCGRCSAVCPVHLMPNYLYMFEQKDRLDELQKYNVLDCIECGACTYICPGRLELTQSIRTAKAKLRAAKPKA